MGMGGRMDLGNMRKRIANRNCVDQSYLEAPAGGLADFLTDPEAAKKSGSLKLAPPSRPRGFEDT